MKIIIYYNIYICMIPYFTQNMLEVGIDEAGRGSLIGDVYVAAVILPQEIDFELNDSKKLSRHKRLILKDYIEEIAIDYAIASADQVIIDQINILNASIETMHNALKKLNVEPEYILVDGNRFKPYYDRYGKYVPHSCIVSGDAQYNSIAAASILAKVYHDEHINKLCDEYPNLDTYYKLRNNMGYGTEAHLNGINDYGISQFHRKSYKTSFDKPLITIDHI